MFGDAQPLPDNTPIAIGPNQSLILSNAGNSSPITGNPVTDDASSVQATTDLFKSSLVSLFQQIGKVQDAQNYFAYQIENANSASSTVAQYNDGSSAGQNAVATVANSISDLQSKARQCAIIIDQLSTQLDKLCDTYDSYVATKSASFGGIQTSDDVIQEIVAEKVVPAVYTGDNPTVDSTLLSAQASLDAASQAIAAIANGATVTPDGSIAPAPPSPLLVYAGLGFLLYHMFKK